MTDKAPISLKDMVIAGMAAKPADIWPQYGTGESLDRSKYITSSEIGYCERMIFLGKQKMKANGYSPKGGTKIELEDNGWGVMQRGHAIEAWIVKQLDYFNSKHVELELMGADQRSFADKYQSGTPDGLAKLKAIKKNILIEIKTIDPRTNTRKLPKETHKYQVTQNIDLVASVLDIEIEGALLVYVDASDFTKMHEFYIPFDVDFADELMVRAERIATATDAAELSPEGMAKEHCKYCDHTAECNAIVRRNMAQNGKLTNDEINASARKLFGQLQGPTQGTR